ncbi:hypothetical protein [Aldersonia kunmingensis]|uniref:hypothetical protein n=1 Tax=Aldersonia kunmingensis TaxID=408066 RepID=UPI000836AB11|nr:hypothetical protein [Aldersonia kunmingensis]
MKPALAGFDRAVSAILGIALIAGGLLVIGWWAEIDPVRDLFGYADQEWYTAAPEQNWWPWALAAATLTGLALGGWLLLENVRPNRAGELELETGVEVGTATIETGPLAEATAAILSRSPEVEEATGIAIDDRGGRTVRITMTAKPDVPLEHLRRLAEEARADITRAIESDELTTQFFVRYLPVPEPE